MKCQRKRKHIEDFFFIAWFVKENEENYCTSGLRNKIFENKRRMTKIKTMKVRGKLVFYVLTQNLCLQLGKHNMYVTNLLCMNLNL